MMEEQLLHSDNGNMAADPMQSYYGASARLREGGLLPELHRLDKEETTWVIKYFKKSTDDGVELLTPQDFVELYMKP